MDMTAITGVFAALKAARDICTSALAVRDWHLVATAIAGLQEQLLNAQQALFTHNTDLLGIQELLIESQDKLRVAEETLAQRANYSLVEVSYGQWAYCVNLLPQEGAAAQPGAAQHRHYVCQACLDNRGKKIVLRFNGDVSDPILTCGGCDGYWVADYFVRDAV